MSTAATFSGTSLPGIVIACDPGRVGVKSQEQELFGNPGATQLTGGLPPADLTLTMWLTAHASSAALTATVSAYQAIAIAGTVGSLVLTGDLTDTYASLALRTVDRVNMHGQKGALPNDPDTPGQWTEFIKLKFRRLQ